jgi:hypothetical protein
LGAVLGFKRVFRVFSEDFQCEECCGILEAAKKVSQNLAGAYAKKGEEALESVWLNTIKDWEISTSYYAMYFSLYSLLARIGAKSEIHSCTIEFARRFLSEYFSE